MNIRINTLFLCFVLGVGPLYSGKNSFKVLGPGRILYSKKENSAVLPQVTPCLWRRLGVLKKKDIEKFIKDPRLYYLCNEWKAVQEHKKTSLFSALFLNKTEFELEEEIRIIWGEQPLAYLDDAQIYSALNSLWSTVKKRQSFFRNTELAVHSALTELERWYCPVIDIFIMKEKVDESDYQKRCPYCNARECCTSLYNDARTSDR